MHFCKLERCYRTSLHKLKIVEVNSILLIKYDVRDAILQGNEKLKVQYLRSLLFYLFEILQVVRAWQRNSASFQILLLWQPDSKLLSIIEKQKVYCLSKRDV